ncbi:sensor histidine kinase [Marinoscillum sp.]|uniref:sensor histidine kinase n=1 Tax=Marinoscillum sp. TaxID=2024838 RepID=UPI003BAB509A
MKTAPHDTGPDQLEKVLFEIICLMILMVMLHGMIQGMLLYGLTVLSVVEFGVSLIAIAFFYSSRYRGKFETLRIPLVLFTNTCLVFFWFWLSGFVGPTGIGAAAIGIISIIILPSKHRNVYLLLNFSLLVSLVIIQRYTDWVRQSVNDYDTLPYDYLVILFSLLLIVNYLKTEYDKERKRAHYQRRDLEYLNQSLETALQEKQHTIQTLQSTQSKLIDSEKMASVGRLTAGLAHELNNPLNFIGGNVKPIINDLEEIKESMSSEALEKNKEVFLEIEQLLDNVLTGSQRATDVINNLLKISPRAKDDQISTILLNELVNRTCLLLKNAHPDVAFKLELNDPVYISGNSIEINQVLLNILKNALDALPSKRARISVKLYLEEGMAVTEVCDNGIGVPAQHRSQIFEPFFTTKDEKKGTGLGLYISYGIVKKHDGEILYEALDKGSCFKIMLPYLDKQ